MGKRGGCLINQSTGINTGALPIFQIKHKNKNIKYHDSPKIISGEVLFLLHNK